MAENDPDNYKKFIDRHLTEGKEALKLPEPEMVVLTHTCDVKGRLDKRVFMNFFSWARVPAPADDRAPVPMTGGRCMAGVSSSSVVGVVGLAAKVSTTTLKERRMMFGELQKKWPQLYLSQ